ncbi:MAG: hypothetical protein QW760_00370, partial [Thermofilaceae archaeon]
MGIRIIFLLTLFVFSTLLLVSIATAQAWLTVTTEFETYEQGDVVEITLQGPIGAEVMLEVRDPLGELIDSKYVVIWPERTVRMTKVFRVAERSILHSDIGVEDILPAIGHRQWHGSQRGMA